MSSIGRESVVSVFEHDLSPGDPSAVALGRSMVSRALVAPDSAETVSADVLDDAVLTASELVTNAIAAALDRVCVAVDIVDGYARVAVYDDGPGTPVTCPRTADQPHGRGLSIVQILSSRWGVRNDPPGKWVWADFPVIPTLAAS